MSEQERRGLERRFDAAMWNLYHRAQREAGYTATRFSRMLSEHGGVETAHLLLRPIPGPDYATGLTELVLRGRPDLTVETLVQEPEFASLFSADELTTARKRLDELQRRPK